MFNPLVLEFSIDKNKFPRLLWYSQLVRTAAIIKLSFFFMPETELNFSYIEREKQKSHAIESTYRVGGSGCPWEAGVAKMASRSGQLSVQGFI